MGEAVEFIQVLLVYGVNLLNCCKTECGITGRTRLALLNCDRYPRSCDDSLHLKLPLLCQNIKCNSVIDTSSRGWHLWLVQPTKRRVEKVLACICLRMVTGMKT